MQIAPHLERHAQYLKAVFAGDASLVEFMDMMQLVRHATIEFGDTRVLLDLRKVNDSLGADDERTLGLQVARTFAHLQKVASLVRDERRTGNSVKTAGKFPLRVFISEDEAVEWLLQ